MKGVSYVTALATIVFIFSCASTVCASPGYHSKSRVPEMPSDSEWTDAISNSSIAAGFNAAYLTGLYSGGIGVPTKELWDRIIQEDRKGITRGSVSPAQLKVDIEIGNLLDSARTAIASNDISKKRDIGASLKSDLAIRSDIFIKYTAYSANKKIDFAGINRLGLNNAHKPGAVSAPSASANCVVVQGQGWTGCAPQ